MFKTLLYSTLTYIPMFAAYLELNPKITNVWYRFSSDGERHVQIWNLIDFIFKPLTMKELWYPEFWDLNFFVGATTLFLSYSIVSYTYNKLNV